MGSNQRHHKDLSQASSFDRASSKTSFVLLSAIVFRDLREFMDRKGARIERTRDKKALASFAPLRELFS
jgi:hypothetical protein